MDGILDLRYDRKELIKATKEVQDLKELNNGFVTNDRMNEIIAANYPPKMSFYN
jgi:hypothetical protein